MQLSSKSAFKPQELTHRFSSKYDFVRYCKSINILLTNLRSFIESSALRTT